MDALSDDTTVAQPGNGRSRRRLWIGATAMAVASVWLAARWSPAGPRVPPPPPGLTVGKDDLTIAADAPQWQLLKLGTAQKATSRWTDPVTAHIAVDQTRASKVGVPLAGHVTRVFVELGQRVQKGEPLFSVASPDIAELRVARERAAVDSEAALATLARVKAIVATRALPAKEEVNATQQARQADLSLRLATSKLASLKVDGSDNEFTVTAPRAGVVVDKNVYVDQQVTPDGSSALMTVADLSSVWIVADVFEADATDVRVGMDAEVTSPALPDVKLSGKVQMVPSVGDPTRHTLPIRVGLTNPDGSLRPNVAASVRFAAAPRTTALEIPASALASDGGRQFVYVQDRPGHFARREVAAGSVRDGRVAILHGLSEGESVVAEGTVLLDNQLSLND
jgi:membrane fusion protein, heavy metal efflux system